MATLDTSRAIACYDLEISNGSNIPWSLASYNIALFYDASVACYRSDSLLLPGFIYRSDNVNHNIVGPGIISNSGLPYEDSLGFIRLGLTFVEEGIGEIIDTSGGQLKTIRICFDLKIDDITSPNTCLQVNYTTPESRAALGVFPDIVQLWNIDNSSRDVRPNLLTDVIPNANYNSCFVLSENTESLCADGIDNDEDGLLDCLDNECNPGDISIVTKSIECFDPLGTIRLEGGSGNVTYSIDGGTTFSQDSIFDSLASGLYDIVVVQNGILGCAFSNPAILQEPDCNESDELSCSDGLDNDGDGLIDCADESCLPRIDNVFFNQPASCPLLSDGNIEIISLYPNIEYSIDSGITFQPDPLFQDLSEGSYHVFVKNRTTQCTQGYTQNPVVLSPLVTCTFPDEICNDGIDNDQDGLIDCLDLDCSSLPVCIRLPAFYLPNIISLNSLNNNVLKLESSEPIDLLDFSVYDRWGNKVYHRANFNSHDENQGWRGELQNNTVASGVYIYHLQIRVEDQILHSTGNVTVIN